MEIFLFIQYSYHNIYNMYNTIHLDVSIFMPIYENIDLTNHLKTVYWPALSCR